MTRNQNANYRQSSQDKWTKMLKRLQAYQQEHNGSCNVPAKYREDPKLGTWVSNQRQHYKKGWLAKERCDQLEKVGFEWKSTRTNGEEKFQDQWAGMLKKLQAYQKEHNGSCDVPQRYHRDPQLGRWVSRQRHRYKKGVLAKEQYDQLEEIGFDFANMSYDKDKWTKMVKRLQAYQQERE